MKRSINYRVGVRTVNEMDSANMEFAEEHLAMFDDGFYDRHEVLMGKYSVDRVKYLKKKLSKLKKVRGIITSISLMSVEADCVFDEFLPEEVIRIMKNNPPVYEPDEAGRDKARKDLLDVARSIYPLPSQFAHYLLHQKEIAHDEKVRLPVYSMERMELLERVLDDERYWGGAF